MSLPPRDPTVPVTLTPDAERITSRVEGWMRETRDRAERGRLKYPPWHTATTTRNAGMELREELMDALWYASAAEDQIAFLLAETDRLRARIAELARGAVESVNEGEWPGAKEWLRQGADLFTEAASGLADMPELPHGLAKRCADAEQFRDQLAARIADLERENARMRPVFEAARRWANVPVAAYFIDTARNQADLSDALRAAVRAAEKEDGNG